MKSAILSLLLTFSTLSAFAATLLSEMPDSVVCQATKVIGADVVKDSGKVSISIQNKNSDRPVVEILSLNNSFHYKIGNGFQGSLIQKPNCAYHFTNTSMYYLCHLDNPEQPVTFLDVMKTNFRSSFSADLVCGNPLNCLRLSGCKKND